jgi:hypothetical protein
MRCLTKPAIIAVRLPEEPALPEAHIGLRKMAEFIRNSAIFFVHPWTVLSSHEPMLSSIEQLL